jgi:hypothetical protein
MRQPKIKYKEYGSIWDRKRRGGGHSRTTPIFGKYERRGGVDSGGTGTKFGKYISKLDVSTNQYVINDEETKTTYKLGLGERRAFGDVYREFESIQQWFDSLDTETQDRIIRIPLDDNMNEVKEATECKH